MSFSLKAAAYAGVATLLISQPLSAQESGVEIDPNVFNIYLESVTQQPASQATAADRKSVV